MKSLLLLAATAILPLAGLLAPVASDDMLVSPYYPLKVGTTWEYTSAGKKIVVKVMSHNEIDGQTCAHIETDASGNRRSEDVTVKEDGIYRVRANDKDIKPPVLILKLPPTKGDSWSIDSAVQNFNLKGKMILGEEKLKVGNDQDYDTLRVKSSDMVMGEKSASMETWFAKDVGMVKQHLKLPAAEYDVVLELTKFTAGK
jgi:hypothetical protein